VKDLIGAGGKEEGWYMLKGRQTGNRLTKQQWANRSLETIAATRHTAATPQILKSGEMKGPWVHPRSEALWYYC
jgi:hypothetical protein